MTTETSIQANIDELEILPVLVGMGESEREYLTQEHSIASARMLSYLKGVIINPNTLFDDIDLEVGNIIAGQGGDYILEVTETAVIAQHKDAVYLESGSPGAYTGDIHTGLIVTANGIAMGYNDQTSGNWVNAVAISSIGNVTVLGTIEAGSIVSTLATISGSGTTIGTVEGNAQDGKDHSNVSGSNPHNTPLATIIGDLDDIADGSTYFRSTATQNTGGTRGYNALNSSYDYVRTISTQNIIVSGSNPTNGTVIDSDGLRGYAGGSLGININNSGTVSFSGDITTGGTVAIYGATTFESVTAALVVIPTNTSMTAIVGKTSTGVGVNAIAINGGKGLLASVSGSGGAAVHAISYSSASPAVWAVNPFGPAITISGSISGDVIIEDDLSVTGTTILGSSTYALGSIYAGNSGITNNSSVLVGVGTATGRNTLVIKEGTVGGNIAGQLHLYGAVYSGSTCLGLVQEQGLLSPSAFAVDNSMPFYYNGSLKYIALSNNP